MTLSCLLYSLDKYVSLRSAAGGSNECPVDAVCWVSNMVLNLEMQVYVMLRQLFPSPEGHNIHLERSCYIGCFLPYIAIAYHA